MPLTGTASKREVCQATFGVMHGVQDVPKPADRIVGVAAALQVICAAKRLDVSEVMNQASRVLKDAEMHTPTELKAALDYARNEL